MQVHRGEPQQQSQEQQIEDLQRQVDKLTAENLLLQEQLARKEQFIAMIAHELRGPLTPIINYAQMLSRHACVPKGAEVARQQRGQGNEVIQRQTSIIISQARRMSRLVKDLLDSSHITSGQFTLMRETCDIVALAKETVEQLRPVAPHHRLVVEAPDTAIIGNWDSGRLQQVLGNLLDNAIKYSDEGTTITVCIWTTPEKVGMSVHNQGASIPSTDIGMLFRPYTRLPATSTRQGSGLGLYITKTIIEAHGGELRLEPHNEDTNAEQQRGTTFSFELPLGN